VKPTVKLSSCHGGVKRDFIITITAPNVKAIGLYPLRKWIVFVLLVDRRKGDCMKKISKQENILRTALGVCFGTLKQIATIPRNKGASRKASGAVHFVEELIPELIGDKKKEEP
jgi:hypothetical protein